MMYRNQKKITDAFELHLLKRCLQLVVQIHIKRKKKKCSFVQSEYYTQRTSLKLRLP